MSFARFLRSASGKWVLLLVFIRALTLAALPFEAIVMYGDIDHFYDLARFAADGPGGLPYLGHWVEFPPLFPFLSLLIYRFAGGVEHIYAYLLAALMLAFDVGSLWLFQRLARTVLRSSTDLAAMAYVGFLAVPAFGWWTFDPMGVFFLLLGVYAMLNARWALGPISVGLGILTKFLPGLAMLVALRTQPLRRMLGMLLVVVLILAAVLVPLGLISPEFTLESLRAQFAKGSWETIWALVDGNLQTGLFGPLSDRLQPVQSTGAPARIPHLIPTLILGALGLWLFARTDPYDERSLLRLVTAALSILFIWSRGWSPQWLAYLVPLLLLSLDLSEALVLGLNLVLLSVLEWPILLSRARFDLLWLPVVLRTGLLVFLLARLSLGLTRRLEEREA